MHLQPCAVTPRPNRSCQQQPGCCRALCTGNEVLWGLGNGKPCTCERSHMRRSVSKQASTWLTAQGQLVTKPLHCWGLVHCCYRLCMRDRTQKLPSTRTRPSLNPASWWRQQTTKRCKRQLSACFPPAASWALVAQGGDRKTNKTSSARACCHCSGLR